jgi:homoserine kinase
MKNDVNLIGRSLNDVIIEPIRSLLIPGFQDAKKAAMDSGALGCSISGSGPSMFALSTDTEKAQKIVTSMERVFTDLGIDVLTYVSQINTHGPTLEEIQS